jgi:two-component system, LytTR family, response regulator AlgR
MATAPLRILIVDDEPLARTRLRSQLASLAAPANTVVGEAGHAQEALAVMATLQAAGGPEVDVVLLDIGLPGRNGLKLADSLRALPSPPVVVFVTAHAEHALQAFDLDAADYLTKPVRAERLASALQRAANRREALAGKRQDLTPSSPSSPEEPVLLIPSRGRVLRLPHREIIYLKADQKLVLLRTPTGTHFLDDSLFDLEQRLGPGFIRVHRNALVAKAAIRELELRELPPEEGENNRDSRDNRDIRDTSEGWAVRVAPLDEWLAVSRRQAAAVRAALEHGAAPPVGVTPPFEKGGQGGI